MAHLHSAGLLEDRPLRGRGQHTHEQSGHLHSHSYSHSVIPWPMPPKADAQDGHGNEAERKAHHSATAILIDIHFSNTKTALSIHFSNILARLGDGHGTDCPHHTWSNRRLIGDGIGAIGDSIGNGLVMASGVKNWEWTWSRLPTASVMAMGTASRRLMPCLSATETATMAATAGPWVIFRHRLICTPFPTIHHN